MSKLTYKLNLSAITEKPSFTESSADELRVLLALLASDGTADSESLARVSSVSEARACSALALWEAEGVIVKCHESLTEKETDGTPVIRVVEDYSSYTEKDEPTPDAREVADTIRDENLALLIDECASLMGKAALPTTDVKHITHLYSALALSPEYIISLAAYLSGKGKLTGYMLRHEAEKLTERDVSTLEELERYIKDRDEEIAAEWEIRRAIGIYNRNLTATERKYFKKWTEEFGYSTAIIRHALDLTVSGTGGNISLPYMDKIISSWHEAGCKTVLECTQHSESTKPAPETKKARRASKTEAPKPRYGDFDTDEAFKAALARSFSDDND